MESKPFKFKNFSVAQDRTTHKVGTDSVLLGAWVNIRQNDKFVLDIGTGSGVIALMLAQRTNQEAKIDAVDIEANDVEQATENAWTSPWPDKIAVYLAPVQQFEPQRHYDLIVTNPPYFVNSLLPPDKKRSRARHTNTLPFEDLLKSISRLLDNRGRAAVILPPAEGSRFLKLAQTFKLFPIRKTSFRSRPHKPVERLLLELAFEGECSTEGELILYAESRTWAPDYQDLVKEFYIDV